MKHKYSYGILPALIFLIFGAAAIILISGWITRHNFDVIGQSALNLATVAANTIEITNEEVRQLEDISFEELQKHPINTKLAHYFRAKGDLGKSLKYVYIIRKLPKDKIKYYVDQADDSNFYKSPPGTPLEWIWLLDVSIGDAQKALTQEKDYYRDKRRYTHVRSSKLKKVYSNMATHYFSDSDEWGEQITGMVPVYTKEGNYVGLLGVDMNAHLLHQYHNMVLTVLLASLLAPVIILLVILLFYHLRKLKKVEDSVARDKLTSVFTRDYFEDQIINQILKLRRAEDSLSAVIIDIDDFKRYNDYYGHVQGDQTLEQVGSVIRSEAETVGGYPARYGGDEFTVVVPNLGFYEGDVLCHNICKRVEALNIPHAPGAEFEVVTVSIGIYTSHKSDRPLDLRSLIERADKALYSAKLAGRNCFIRN